jgi:N-glycosylase/DNA lyase
LRVRLDTPRGFSFPRTVFGHGWYSLPPFTYDAGGGWLETTVALGDGGAERIRLEAAGDGVRLGAPGRPPAGVRRQLVAAARRALNLDLDLEPFYDVASEHPGMEWVARAGAGRLLRCPTLWEDLVKLVLTTNCSWALTTKMVTELTERYGAPAPDGSRAFPTPEVLARVGERTLRDKVRAGYRAPLLVALSREVARGEVDPEAWERDTREPAELKTEILALPGAGPYVAENLLRFLGRPDGLGLDSWLRAKYARIHHDGRKIKDRTIARRYARFGRWAGLALWCDMTRDWFESDGAPSLRAW